jgi:para-nitrobenzyl esterase
MSRSAHRDICLVIEHYSAKESSGMRRSRFRYPLAAFGAAATAVAVALMFPGPSPRAAATGGATAAARAGDLVRTADGWVRGVPAAGYSEYAGIPYAAPPVGALRWAPPQPVAPWPGVLDATHFGNRCVQGTGWDPGYSTPKLTEDCLYLNVYAPATAQKNLPVLVWIHGGGFTGGAGQDTDPRQYVQKNDAVVVTINYRLGILGYLNLPQLPADGRGNFGLLDQQAALRWVNENIAAFGGDPHNITIAGQSAGGSSVCDQLASPTAKGLFEKAVIMSGSCGMATAAQGQATSQQVVAALGCAKAPDVLACLRAVPPSKIVAVQATGLSPRPSIGGAAFPIDPGQAVAVGKFNRVPVINGSVHDERRLFVFQDYDYAGHPLTAGEYVSLVNSTYGKSAAQVLAKYPVASYPSPDIAWATVQTDSLDQARKVTDDELSKWTPTYAYEFDVENTPQFTSIFRLQQTNAAAKAFPFGATHVDDLAYLWQYLGQTVPLTDAELALSDQMIAYWGNFQRTGNPNGYGHSRNSALPVWDSYNAGSPQWLEERACDADPAGNGIPAACSVSGNGFLTDHNVAFWTSVLG